MSVTLILLGFRNVVSLRYLLQSCYNNLCVLGLFIVHEDQDLLILSLG